MTAASLREPSGRSRLATCLLFALIAVVLFCVTPLTTPYDGPYRLAQRLLAGQSYLPEFLPWIEMFRHDGRDYLAYPPMVSFVLLPFASAANGAVAQPIVNSLLIFASTLVLYFLVRRLEGIEHLARVAVIAYLLGTPILYSAETGDVWLLMHTQGNFFFLLALLLGFTGRRYFLAGACFMVAVGCRHSIALAAPVFALRVLERAGQQAWLRESVRSGSLFLLGAAGPALAMLLFQWWTLGDAFLSPYAVGWMQWGILGPAFSPLYIRAHLMLYFFAHPTVLSAYPYLRFDLTGQSILVMSPFFLGLFAARLKLPFVRAFLVGALAMFAFYLAYYHDGMAQYGTRYMQDLYPLLVPMSMSAFTRPGRFWKGAMWALVTLAVAINLYGAWLMRGHPG